MVLKCIRIQNEVCALTHWGDFGMDWRIHHLGTARANGDGEGLEVRLRSWRQGLYCHVALDGSEDRSRHWDWSWSIESNGWTLTWLSWVKFKLDRPDHPPLSCPFLSPIEQFSSSWIFFNHRYLDQSMVNTAPNFWFFAISFSDYFDVKDWTGRPIQAQSLK